MWGERLSPTPFFEKIFLNRPWNLAQRQTSASFTSRSRQPAKEMLSCSTARCSAVRPDFCSCALTSAPAATSSSRQGMLLLITATWMAFRPAAQAQGQSQGGKAVPGWLPVQLKEMTRLIHRVGGREGRGWGVGKADGLQHV